MGHSTIAQGVEVGCVHCVLASKDERIDPVVFIRSLSTLAHNLAWAGALCRAFIEGCKQTAAAVAIDNSDYEVEPELLTRPAWFPGCNRSAP